MEQQGRILIVDDEENLRHLLSVVLSKEGYRCEEARDGAAALERLLVEPFDVVLCDLNMPRLSGMQLLSEVKERGIDTTFIVLTAYGSLESAVAAMKLGAYDYVNKPFKPDEVLLVLRKAYERERLRAENRQLKKRLGEDYGFTRILSQAANMAELFKMARKVAGFKSTVLLTGESGTGKELFARAIHATSERQDAPFVAVNCGAIPESLIESELFGHEKGAFTDAHKQRKGLFEEAKGGTLFLDEIGELPFALQVKLLRVLQESEIRRVGGTAPIPTDVRLIAATVKDLTAEVGEGRFREDLFYRLNVMHLKIPPLRERTGDVALLVTHFISHFNARMGLAIKNVTPEALARLAVYHWPGNVRELENIIERAMVLCDTDEIGMSELPPQITEWTPFEGLRLSEDNLSIKKAVYAIENDLIRKALGQTGGNRTAAARILEISHRALLYKIKEYRIE